MKIEDASKKDGNDLADLRALAMRESLESVGRFDPVRVRDRFLSTFKPANTKKILVGDKLVGFYVALEKEDHIYLDHLYIIPDYQGNKYGSTILNSVIENARAKNKVIRLGALKKSKSNEFYLSHGFLKTHEEEFDNYYELQHS